MQKKIEKRWYCYYEFGRENSKIEVIDWINEINFNIYKYNLDSEYTIIDLHSAFIDKNGLMIQSLFRDGIHLNDAGYQVWVDYIYKYVDSLSNNHRSAD